MRTMLNDDGTPWDRAKDHLVQAALYGVLAALLILGRCTPVEAGVPCNVPFNIQNGQPADATQVMANYHALEACLGNAAAAGVNSDITSLTGLATPIAPTFGGTQTFVATATATGTANAIIVASTTPPWTALTRGYTVSFIPSTTNTGPATLQVGSSAATAVLRRSLVGAIPLVGGEIVQSSITIASYDGTNFQLLSEPTQVPVGTVLTTISSVADPGFVLLQGQCLSSTGVFGLLYFKLGSPPTGVAPCGAGQFKLPDARGRVIAMIDSGGSGRITAAGGVNFDGTVLYNSGGADRHTMTVNELVSHQHDAFIRDPKHHHSINTIISGSGLAPTGAAGVSGSANTSDEFTGVKVNSDGGASPTPATDNQTGDVKLVSGTHGNAFSVLPPIIMFNYQVKY